MGQDPHFGVNFQTCSKCPKMVSKVFTSIWEFFFLPARKTWIRPLFLDFFENRPNYAISMVHNVFQGHLEVAEHVFDIIFMFHDVFDSV